MALSWKTYTVSNADAFRATPFNLPPNSLVFLSHETSNPPAQPPPAGLPPGVLLLPGIHYLVYGDTMTLGTLPLSVGDVLAVVTWR